MAAKVKAETSVWVEARTDVIRKTGTIKTKEIPMMIATNMEVMGRITSNSTTKTKTRVDPSTAKTKIKVMTIRMIETKIKVMTIRMIETKIKVIITIKTIETKIKVMTI
jgi:hypothetical protein